MAIIGSRKTKSFKPAFLRRSMAGLVCLKMDKHSQTADDEDCY